MYTFRTKATHDLYEEHKRNRHMQKGCALCGELPMQEFTHWKIMNNKFPYDHVSQVHHMLVTKRHVQEDELTDEERRELGELKKTYLDEQYTFVLEALPGKKSIPEHFHLHLIVPKEIF